MAGEEGRRILVATRSAGKLRELTPALRAAGFSPIGLDDAGLAETPAEASIECFETFEENALAKARYFQTLSTLPVVADDSGLELEALGGRPGVHSKRWAARADLAGELLDAANNEKMLVALAPHPNRRGRYVCVMAFADGVRTVVGRGECRGVLLAAPRGDGGFGYDPYFLSEELGATFAEVPVAEKAQVSHRGRALAALLGGLGAGR